VGQRPNRHDRIASGNPWSAGCAETCSSGAEGGPGKRAGGNAETAPRSDPYTKLLGPARWTYYYLYVVLDIYRRYAVGWMLAERESAALAEQLLADTIGKQRVDRDQLTIHADNGSSMASKPVAFLLADLGVTKTHSRPHCSNDNPYSEAQFRTLKYRPDFPDRFASLVEARAFCQRFFAWYNTEHRHSGIAWHTPHNVHYGHADAVQEIRADVLAAAYARNPERFVRKHPEPAALPTATWINKPADHGQNRQAVNSTNH
jgi:putative transposase